MIAIKLLTRSLPQLWVGTQFEACDCWPPLQWHYSFCFTLGTHAQRLRFQRLQHTGRDHGAEAWLSAVLPSSITRVSCASLVNALPASCPVSRRAPGFPASAWAPRLISCCWKVSVVCQLHREERERTGPLPLLCNYSPICSVFSVTGKNWSSDFNWQGPLEFFREGGILLAFRGLWFPRGNWRGFA